MKAEATELRLSFIKVQKFNQILTFRALASCFVSVKRNRGVINSAFNLLLLRNIKQTALHVIMKLLLN